MDDNNDIQYDEEKEGTEKATPSTSFGLKTPIAILVVSTLLAFCIYHLCFGRNEENRDRSIDASYEYLSRDLVYSSPLPDVLDAKFTKVKNLWIAPGPVTDDDLKKLIQSHEVEELELKWSEITADSLKLLETQPIVGINFHFMNISPKEAEILAKLKKLRRLGLMNCTGLDPDTIKELNGPQSLKKLHLRACDIKPDDCKQLLSHYPALASLDLRGARYLDDSIIEQLERKKDLKDLILTGTKISESGVMRLCSNRNLSITHWELESMPIGDRVIEILASTPVAHLNVSNTKITDKSLPKLASCKTLDSLYIYDCKDISTYALRKLRVERPNLVILDKKVQKVDESDFRI